MAAVTIPGLRVVQLKAFDSTTFRLYREEKVMTDFCGEKEDLVVLCWPKRSAAV